MSQTPYTPGSSTPATDGPDTWAPIEGATSSPDAGSSSTTDAAKEQGRQVGQEAVAGGQHVASVAADQAKSVTSEAADQAKNLMAEAKSQLSDQAVTQQGNLATWLHSLADELRTLTDKTGSSASGDSTSAGSSGARAFSDSGEQGSADRPAAAAAGVVTNLASQATDQVKGAADWLESHEPADLLDQATRFARQRPGAFLALAAVAGLAAGRLTRGLTAGEPETDVASTPPAVPASPAVPVTPVVPTEDVTAYPADDLTAYPADDVTTYPAADRTAAADGSWVDVDEDRR